MFLILLYRVTDFLKGFFFIMAPLNLTMFHPFVIWAKFFPNLKEIWYVLNIWLAQIHTFSKPCAKRNEHRKNDLYHQVNFSFSHIPFISALEISCWSKISKVKGRRPFCKFILSFRRKVNQISFLIIVSILFLQSNEEVTIYVFWIFILFVVYIFHLR